MFVHWRDEHIVFSDIQKNLIKDLEEELLEKDEDEIVEKVRRVLVVAKTKTKEEILKPIKSLIIELLKLELKPLLSHLKYAYLGKNFPKNHLVIIST